MEVFANELSFLPGILNDYKNIECLKEVYVKLVENSVTVCRISNEDLVRLINELQSDATKSNLLNFCYAFFRAPYESNSDVEQKQDEYYSHDWNYEGTTCFGLAMSFMLDTLAFSINKELWHEIVHINRDSDKLEVRNVSSGEHVEYYKDWFLQNKRIELVTTNVALKDKPISLRDDHGKDVLYEFSKKICKSPYVEGIINSLPFNSHEKRFVHKISANGVVECVLCWTDEGYGIAVQTTGRNIRETEKIAGLLKDEFSK